MIPFLSGKIILKFKDGRVKGFRVQGFLMQSPICGW